MCVRCAHTFEHHPSQRCCWPPVLLQKADGGRGARVARGVWVFVHTFVLLCWLSECERDQAGRCDDAHSRTHTRACALQPFFTW